jgi:predicted alpha/beta superfamily hydrolase
MAPLSCLHLGAALVVTLIAFQLEAQSAPPTVSQADSVPAHETFSIDSRAVGESRTINVHTPRGYDDADTTRFPVLYMPDGGIDEDFPHVVNTVDSLLALGQIRPVIIVGIPNTERRRDLTGPTKVASDSSIAPHVGGSAAFRRFMRDELMPVVRNRYRTSGERAIVGESLAGLFIVETFLVEPSLFDHYVAFDPSLWWNGGALVDSAPGLLKQFDGSHRTLYLASSRDVEEGPARIAAMLKSGPPKGLEWIYTPRQDLTHGTIFRAMAPAALLSALH